MTTFGRRRLVKTETRQPVKDPLASAHLFLHTYKVERSHGLLPLYSVQESATSSRRLWRDKLNDGKALQHAYKKCGVRTMEMRSEVGQVTSTKEGAPSSRDRPAALTSLAAHSIELQLFKD